MNSRLYFFFYIIMLFAKYEVSTLSKVKTTRLSFWYHESVRNFIERESVRAEVFSSPSSIAVDGDLNFLCNIYIASVCNSGVSERRELTVVSSLSFRKK